MYYKNSLNELFIMDENELLAQELGLIKISDNEAKMINDNNTNLQKQLKLKALEELKESLINADIIYNDKLYQADKKSLDLLTQSLTLFSALGQTPLGFKWKSTDNSLNDFSLDDLKALAGLIAARTQSLTAKYWLIKEQIKNANTKEELELIKVSFDD